MNMTPNMAAILKVAASVYDMYDHEHYAERHNANSPKRKPLELLAEAVADNAVLVRIPVQGPVQVAGMPSAWPVNGPCPYADGVVPHRYVNNSNIMGTGHGDVIGRPNRKTPYHG